MSAFGASLGNTLGVKIVATNLVGDSAESQATNIQLGKAPDAPVSLTFDGDSSSKTEIKITWQDGSSNGGETITHYEVYYNEYNEDEGQGDFSKLATNVGNEYTTTISLSPGKTYVFQVSAVNKFDESVRSESLVVPFSFRPVAPTNVVADFTSITHE